MSAVRSIGAVVFGGFETLDLFGPLQMFGTLADRFGISIVAEQHRQVISRHGQKLSVDHAFEDRH